MYCCFLPWVWGYILYTPMADADTERRGDLSSEVGVCIAETEELSTDIWSNFRVDLLEKVIARLPLKNIIRATTLSKFWRFNILSSRFFHQVKFLPTETYTTLRCTGNAWMGYDWLTQEWQHLFLSREFPPYETYLKAFGLVKTSVNSRESLLSRKNEERALCRSDGISGPESRSEGMEKNSSTRSEASVSFARWPGTLQPTRRRHCSNGYRALSNRSFSRLTYHFGPFGVLCNMQQQARLWMR